MVMITTMTMMMTVMEAEERRREGGVRPESKGQVATLQVKSHHSAPPTPPKKNIFSFYIREHLM